MDLSSTVCRIELKGESVSHGNDTCGSIKTTIDNSPSGKIGTADKKSSKYYLQIFKVEDDGHNIQGKGTLSNKK